MKRVTMGALTLVMLAACGVANGDGVKSGPQVGDSKSITPFHPLNATGAAAGKKLCLV